MVLRGYVQQGAGPLLQLPDAYLVPERLLLQPAQASEQLVERVADAQRVVPADRTGLPDPRRVAANIPA